MAGSVNTASLLLVAMLVSSMMAYTVLAEDPQITVPTVSERAVGEADLGDVQDLTATDDGSLETAALGRRGKKQRLQDRVEAHFLNDNEGVVDSGDSHKQGHHSHHKAGSTHSKAHKAASEAQGSMEADLSGEADATSSTHGPARRHTHSSRRSNRRHRGGAGSASIFDTLGQLWPDSDAAETEGEGPDADGDLGSDVSYGGSNGKGNGNGHGDNFSSHYSSNKPDGKPYGGSKPYQGSDNEYDSKEYNKEDTNKYYAEPSPTQPGRKQHKSGSPQRPQEHHTRKGGKHSNQHSAGEVTATGSQDTAAKLWDYGWYNLTSH